VISAATGADRWKVFLSKHVDGVAFVLNAVMAFAIYFLTLAPQVTFGYSGIDATAALYPGAASPSGHPVWAIFGWAVMKVFPFSNIAWRLGIGCAVAAAMACGFVAATISRIGGLVFRSESFERLSHKEQNVSRVVCASVAALGLAFERGFWSKAVVVDTWPLTMLLFTSTMFCLSIWFFELERKRWLWLAAFLHGLSLTESQALAPVTFALPFFLTFGNPKLGRDLLFIAAGSLCAILSTKKTLWVYGWQITPATNHLLIAALILTTISWLVSWFVAGRTFREIKTIIMCLFLFGAGLMAYFLVPIFSMTNPPMNWGYARTEEGFFHVLSRGQFDSFQPTADFGRFIRQCCSYVKGAIADLGPFYVLAVLIPFLFFREMPNAIRRWLVGTLLMWILVTAQIIVGLNLEAREMLEYESLFAPVNALLMMLAGIGLMRLAGRRDDRSNTAHGTNR
jgi:hypothetical protein